MTHVSLACLPPGSGLLDLGALARPPTASAAAPSKRDGRYTASGTEANNGLRAIQPGAPGQPAPFSAAQLSRPLFLTSLPVEGQPRLRRTVTLYAPGTMSYSLRLLHARKVLASGMQHGDLNAYRNASPQSYARGLDYGYALQVTEGNGSSEDQLVGGLEIDLDFAGARGDNQHWLGGSFEPGTAYLSGLFGTRAAGRQAAIVGLGIGGQLGARLIEMGNPWSCTQHIYKKYVGAHPPNQAAVPGLPWPDLIAYDARFTTPGVLPGIPFSAGPLLFAAPSETLPPELCALVRQAGSPEAVDALLPKRADLYSYIGNMPDGVLLVSYRMRYSSPAPG